MLPIVAPNTTIIANSATAPPANAMPTIDTACTALSTRRSPEQREPRHHASADQPGDHRGRCQGRDREAGAAGAGSLLGELHQLLDAPTWEPSARTYPTVTAGKNRLRIAVAYSAPLVSAAPTRRRSARRRAPSRAAADRARTRNQANGTVPSTYSTPSHGVPARMPWLSSNSFATGVSTTPPTDRPVEVIDSDDRTSALVPARDHRASPAPAHRRPIPPRTGRTRRTAATGGSPGRAVRASRRRAARPRP